MKKALVVIEGTVQARAAVSLLCERTRSDDCEVVLVCFRAKPADWQRHSWTSERELAQADARERAALAVAWQLLSGAGMFYKTKIVNGDFASTIAAIASAENCDHIFVSRPPESPVLRKVFALTGLKLGGAFEHLLELADAPVTVVGSRAAALETVYATS